MQRAQRNSAPFSILIQNNKAQTPLNPFAFSAAYSAKLCGKKPYDLLMQRAQRNSAPFII
jgi:hypothetical protein